MTVARPGAVVLAGGQSRRMGRDKNWLDVAGVPLLEHVVGIVAAVCPNTVVVAGPDRRLPALPPLVTRLDDPVDRQGEGPLPAFARGLEWLRDRGVRRAFVAGNDLALVSSEHVRFMLAALSNVDAAVPVDDGTVPHRWHPLAAAVNVGAVATVATNLVAAGERRLLSLFETVRSRPLERGVLPDPTILMPCNTPEDWIAICAIKGWK